MSPGQSGSVDSLAACGPKGPGLIHIKGTYLAVGSSPALALLGARAGGNQLVCFSHIDISLCLSLFHSL